MVAQLTTGLLWTLVIVGGWNTLNMIARAVYRENPFVYWWSTFVGAWALGILLYR